MKFAALAAACAAVAFATSAIAQSYSQRVDTARFDARATPDVAAKLAICDATRFLQSRPDFEADLVYVRRDDGRVDLLLPPHFVGGPQWYDEDLESAYRRLKRQGVVNHDQVRLARAAIGRDMVRAFRRPSGGEQRFLREQSRYCKTVEDAGRA
jgi:hypothetical protein